MSASNGFTVSNWKAHESRTLKGYLSLELPSGMVVHGWSYHEQGDKRWLSPPAKEWPKGKYTPIIEIPDEQKRAKFQEGALAAVDAWMEGQRG